MFIFYNVFEQSGLYADESLFFIPVRMLNEQICKLPLIMLCSIKRCCCCCCLTASYLQRRWYQTMRQTISNGNEVTWKMKHPSGLVKLEFEVQC